MPKVETGTTGQGDDVGADWIAGVDGCPAGWVAALRPVSGDGEPRVVVVRSFTEILALGVGLVAVDMPIGLPERVGAGGRGPERALRPLLGERQSSVFSVPSRAAVYAPDYRAACEAALATSDPPRKISKQAFFLFPKIREIDALLRTAPGWRGRVFETHPEGAFMVMNGERPLGEPKKVKGRPWPAGMALRRGLLAAAGLPRALLDHPVPRGAAEDDLLDAMACSVTALRLAKGVARPFADGAERDDHGLPMTIWA